MPKRNIPNYRLHKASGQAVVELDGRTFYLGKHGSKASREEYERRIAEYLGNGRRLPPTRVNTGISCQELAIHYLEWAEKHHVKQPKSFRHCKRAMSFLVEHYGTVSVDEFSARSLLYLQDRIVNTPNDGNELGAPLTRKTVNRYIGLIKQAFKLGTKFGFVSPTTHYALQVVDQLRKGHTSAPDNPSVKPVDPVVFEKTLPHLSKRVADMCRVQCLCAMRPQDVCNLRTCDIDRSGDVWLYRPPAHKTAHLGAVLTKYIGTAAQEILMPYLAEKADNPEAFLFSPADTVRDKSIERRRNRKNLNKKGDVQPSQKERKKKDNPKKASGAEGVVVIAESSTGEFSSAITDHLGNFRLDSLKSGTWKVSILSSGLYQPIPSETVTVNSASQVPRVNFTLSATGSISGRVLDKSNKPLADVLVKVVNNLGEQVATAVTDAAGNYLIENIPAGTYRIFATSETLAWQQREIVVKSNETVSTNLIAASSFLMGKVFLSGSTPATTGNVFIYNVNKNDDPTFQLVMLSAKIGTDGSYGFRQKLTGKKFSKLALAKFGDYGKLSYL